MATATFFSEDQLVHVPEHVVDLASFRAWFQSDEFPEYGRICFINGEVQVYMSREPVR